jgi:hypothetical protein
MTTHRSAERPGRPLFEQAMARTPGNTKSAIGSSGKAADSDSQNPPTVAFVSLGRVKNLVGSEKMLG